MYICKIIILLFHICYYFIIFAETVPKQQEEHDIVVSILKESYNSFTTLGHFDDNDKIFMEKSYDYRNDISYLRRSNLNDNHTIIISCRRKNMDKLKEIILDMADITSENSQKRMTQNEIHELTLSTESIIYVLQYLRNQSISINESSFSGNEITATAPIVKWQSVFGTQFNDYQLTNKFYNLSTVVTRAVNYSLPRHLTPHIEYIHHLTHFPMAVTMKPKKYSRVNNVKNNKFYTEAVSYDYTSPSVIKSVYKIPTTLTGNNLGSQAFFGSLGQIFNPNDLSLFQSYFQQKQQSVTGIQGTGGNSSNYCSSIDKCIKANLDVQYLMSTSPTTPTYYTYYADTNGFIDWNAWLTTIEAMAKPPLVISISYGSTSVDAMSAYFTQFDNLAVLLAARGVTLIAASGDLGANSYLPMFPATSQYVTAVGATQGPEQNTTEIVCSKQSDAGITSGGGFSTHESAPAWQTSHISSYFSSLSSSQEPLSGYNRNGRGYPDVSLLGRRYGFIINGYKVYITDGTSASTSVFAGMVALVNAVRLASGNSSLGWINPSLYANYKSFILNDIISGNNMCNQTTKYSAKGFYAAPGWDPVSGLGSINFAKFLTVFAPIQAVVITNSPTSEPSAIPSISPTYSSTIAPTAVPTTIPTKDPTTIPTAFPTFLPSVIPSPSPSQSPTVSPTILPSPTPSINPTFPPTTEPTINPSYYPTTVPTFIPTIPTYNPSYYPTFLPSDKPTCFPSVDPSVVPSQNPSNNPTYSPSLEPSNIPSNYPTAAPSFLPTSIPTINPTQIPSSIPSYIPSSPSCLPSYCPSVVPSVAPSMEPSCLPSYFPSLIPSKPSAIPSILPTYSSTIAPTAVPTAIPTKDPTITPTAIRTFLPSVIPSPSPSQSPTVSPTILPSPTPSINPTFPPTTEPTINPSYYPTTVPSSQNPSNNPTYSPSVEPSNIPSNYPTAAPSFLPTSMPTSNPTRIPSSIPSYIPSIPSCLPSYCPSLIPSASPTFLPTYFPTFLPTTSCPSIVPTNCPSASPSYIPSLPTVIPTILPSFNPTRSPSSPSMLPSFSPTRSPSSLSMRPSLSPSSIPSITLTPTTMPTLSPFPVTVQFLVKQQLNGISYSTYMNNSILYSLSIKQSIVKSVQPNITIANIQNLLVTTTQNSIRLSAVSNYILLNYFIITNDQSANAISRIQNSLFKSVASNQFDESLAYYGALNGVYGLYSVQSTIPLFQVVVTTSTPSRSPTISVPTSPNSNVIYNIPIDIIVPVCVVIGSLIIAVCILVMVYYYYFQRGVNNSNTKDLNDDNENNNSSFYNNENVYRNRNDSFKAMDGPAANNNYNSPYSRKELLRSESSQKRFNASLYNNNVDDPISKREPTTLNDFDSPVISPSSVNITIPNSMSGKSSKKQLKTDWLQKKIDQIEISMKNETFSNRDDYSFNANSSPIYNEIKVAKDYNKIQSNSNINTNTNNTTTANNNNNNNNNTPKITMKESVKVSNRIDLL